METIAGNPTTGGEREPSPPPLPPAISIPPPPQSPTSTSAGTLTLTLTQTLIPGLPDDLAALILVALPYSHRCRLRSTSRSWHAFLSAASIAPLRRLLRLPPRHILCVFPSDPSVVRPFLFDPAAGAWATLPTLPCSPYLYGLSKFSAVALGPHLYIVGGSHFDARSFPLGIPLPSAAVHRLNLSDSSAFDMLSWTRLPDMLSTRGSFACAPVPGGNAIIVAGGGSRHAMFSSTATPVSFADIFNVDSGEWVRISRLPRYRSGCFGFFPPKRQRQHQDAEDDEFWVMGGFGEYRPVAGVVPANIYYRDVLALGMKSRKWRVVGDMWEAGERYQLGQVVAMDGVDGELMGVFMLDRNTIFRYDIASNCWHKESSLRRKISPVDTSGFVAMNGELCVLTKAAPFVVQMEHGKVYHKRFVFEIQAYDPHGKKWRFFSTNPPFPEQIDFQTAVTCTIQL